MPSCDTCQSDVQLSQYQRLGLATQSISTHELNMLTNSCSQIPIKGFLQDFQGSDSEGSGFEEDGMGSEQDDEGMGEVHSLPSLA